MAKRLPLRLSGDPATYERLLTEARRHRGMSLGRDAWRRLRQNRGAATCLWFLGLFGLLSFLAPFLPLASPTALALREEPLGPAFPLGSNPRLDPDSLARLGFGAAPTRAVAALADDGWAHRTFVDVELPLPLGTLTPSEDGEVRRAVERATGRAANVYLAPGTRGDTFVQRHAVPQLSTDRAEDVEVATGRSALLVGEWLRPESGPGWVRLEVRTDPMPQDGDPPRAHSLSVTPRGLEARRVLGPSHWPLVYRLRWPELAKAEPLSVAFAGAWLPASSHGDPGLDRAFGAAPTLSLDLGEKRIALAPEAAGEHYQRRERVVDEYRVETRDPLAETVAAALSELGRGTLLPLEHSDGIWKLSALDRRLMDLRARVFGLWQSGPILGTDAKGRDLLARILWGSRISIQVAIVATLCSLAIGVTWGAVAGFLGGRIDNAMMRIVDLLYSVPFIFVVIFLITLLNEYRTDLADRGIGYMTVFYLVIGAIYWLTMARVVRGQVLALKNQEFIEAARVLGASTARILFVHAVPNVLSVVIVYLTLTIPAVMLFEAFLSFLGLGVEPPQVSWGLLAVDATDAISAVVVYWWLILFPSLAMGSVLLALNVLGDGLRDALDPKLRGR